MANNHAWNAYIDNFNTEPKDASQLQAYVKKNANLANLSFKDANALYKANKGKGKVGGGDAGGGASESKEAEPSGASNPLFAQLNQGGNITKGLKKVTRDMTNKDKKISGKIADSNKPKSSGPPKKKAAANKPKKVKPPAIRKQGFRIWVENFVEGVEEIKEAGLKNEVYIVNCRDAGFSLPNKCKAVIVDSCSKIQVEIDSVLTSVDLINTKSCTLYLKSNVPTLNVDKSASPRIVLFQALLDNNPQIVTSMTSDMNISVPGIDEDADFKDVPVPYQFITTVDPETKEVRTVPMQHTG